MKIDIYRSHADGSLTVSNFPADGAPPAVARHAGPFSGDGQAPVMSEEQTQETFWAAIGAEMRTAMDKIAEDWDRQAIVDRVAFWKRRPA